MNNIIIFIGNLTADPETRTTKDGKTVVSFTVAVNRRHEGVDWFRVSAWNKLGELCRMYLAKGRKVSVVGEIHAGAYINSKGEAVGTLEVNAQDIEFLTPKDAEAQYQREERQAIQDEAEGYVQVSNEELPF